MYHHADTAATQATPNDIGFHLQPALVTSCPSALGRVALVVSDKAKANSTWQCKQPKATTPTSGSQQLAQQEMQRDNETTTARQKRKRCCYYYQQ